jgi:aspartyl aminopeptidase
LTAHGANSNFLPTILGRLSSLPSSRDGKVSAAALDMSLAKSFLVAADMAHAVHPNYSTKYEDRHKPRLNEGVVVKVPNPPVQLAIVNMRSTQMRDMPPIPLALSFWMRSPVAPD